MGENKNYTIGGEEFIQAPLVLGQIEQLIQVIESLTLPEFWGPEDVLKALGSNLSKAMGIVLIPKGMKLMDKDLEEVTNHFRWNLDTEMAVEIVADFFVCNPIQSLLVRLMGMMPEGMQTKIQGQMDSLGVQSGSTT